MKWYPLFDVITALTGERAAIIFAHAIAARGNRVSDDLYRQVAGFINPEQILTIIPALPA